MTGSEDLPTGGSPHTGDEERPKARQEEREALEHQERIVLRAILGFLLLITMFFWGANYYALRTSRTVDSPLRLVIQSALEGPIELWADAQWESGPERVVSHPPEVWLDGAALPTEFTVRPGGDAAGSERVLTVAVPWSAPSGWFRGRIVVSEIGYSARVDARDWDFPLAVEVPTFWEDWSLLRGWLFVLAASLFVFYAVLLYAYPAPRGTLHVVVALSGTEDQTATPIRLRSGLLGLLRPWTRSALPLERVFRRDSHTQAAAILVEEMTLEFSRFGPQTVLVHYLNVSDTRTFVSYNGLPSKRTERRRLTEALGLRRLGTEARDHRLVVPEKEVADYLGGFVAISYDSGMEIDNQPEITP